MGNEDLEKAEGAIDKLRQAREGAKKRGRKWEKQLGEIVDEQRMLEDLEKEARDIYGNEENKDNED